MESPKNQEPAKDGEAPRQPKRTLFVRSLPTSATTDSLAEYFSQSYVIKHAIVVTDPETHQSKGFGFVTFADIEDAQRALEEFNGADFDGKKIKVDYAESRHREVDESIGKSVPAGPALEFKKKREEEKASTQPPKLIVRNLPWSIKEPEDLAIHFRSFGKVKQATLPKRGTTLAGFGFVVLRGKKNAEKALEAVNGKEVDGRTLAVDWAVEKTVWEDLQKKEQEQEKEKKKGNKGKQEESSDVEMAEGSEKGSDASEDEATSEDAEDDEDMEQDDDEDEDEDEEDEEDDEEDDIEDEEEEEEKEDDRNASTIFIRNLPFTCSDEVLYEHFTQFGPLRYARIVVDPETERPRGTGFVCFWRVEDSMTCVREAPKQQDNTQADKDKGKKSSAIKHSVLQNETTDPSGRYTMDGRVLQVARAVSKNQAAKLEEEGVSRRLVRDTDKRRLFLLSEGTIPTNSPLYKQLAPSEISMREDSFKQRQNFIKKNPTLHLSLTRLSIRNVPRHVTSKDLKQLARQGVVGFAEEAKKGLRQPLSKEELQRSAEDMKEAEHLRKKKGQGVVRQAKIVFEGREGSKIEEKSGAGRSRGYGFLEYFTHRHALMALRWLNGHAVPAPKSGAGAEDPKDKKKRLIVEFAIENAQVVKRRNEMQERQQEKTRNFAKGNKKDESSDKADESKGKRLSGAGQKRKRSESRSNKDKNNNIKKSKSKQDGVDDEEANKVAKRNRVIAKKRMQRRGRKGKG